MPQKTLYLCQDSKAELLNISDQEPAKCKLCGGNKFYKNHHHQCAAKKISSKGRWSYGVK